MLRGQGNFDDALMRTCKVGSYKPNRLGLYDMHGNVHEWCEGFLFRGKTDIRVTRGGGWNCNSEGCRAANRIGTSPSARFNFVGLRVARVPAGKEILKVTGN